jgi:F-type H+-transporting ATPase subunit alpha
MKGRKKVLKNKVSPVESIKGLERAIKKYVKAKKILSFNEYGVVLSVQDGVALATGLKSVGISEIVKFRGGVNGQVSTLERDVTRICLMGPDKLVKPGVTVHRLRKFIQVPVGKELLGRVVDSLGKPIDGKGMLLSKRDRTLTKTDSEKRSLSDILTSNLKATETQKAVRTSKNEGQKASVNLVSKLPRRRVERPAPGIMHRMSIHEPLQTGTKVIDALIPIGRGQRELILGDRNTGKTTIALDAMINQSAHNKAHPNDKIYSVYVAVGQRQSKVQEVVNLLTKHNAFEDSCVVFAPSYAPVILQFIAPYAGTTIAEYFRDTGRHALVIYDDLTKHAQIHRQLSLLLKTPPGREAYPGDVFYVHARLLERSAKLSKAKGAGSLTAFLY